MLRRAKAPESLLTLAHVLAAAELRTSAAHKSARAVVGPDVPGILGALGGGWLSDGVAGLGRVGGSLGCVADVGVCAAASEAVAGADEEGRASRAAGGCIGTGRCGSRGVADCGVGAASLEAGGAVVVGALSWAADARGNRRDAERRRDAGRSRRVTIRRRGLRVADA